MLKTSSVVFFSPCCSLLLTKLIVLRKPSRSQWKTTSRQPKASWGRCSSERSTPGWHTTAFLEPPPASCAVARTRSGGKRMRSGQVTREPNSAKNQKTFYRRLVPTTKTTAALLRFLCSPQSVTVSSLLYFYPPHRIHTHVGRAFESRSVTLFQRSAKSFYEVQMRWKIV